MIEIPENIEQLKGYHPGKPIEHMIKELGLHETAILWNNENNQGPSPKALAFVKEALGKSAVYPDAACMKLRSAIAEHCSKKTENIIVGNGSESVFTYILKTFFNVGDELLSSEGTFVAVYVWSQAHNIPCVKVPLTDDYQFYLEGILEKIGPKTKAIYLSNPNNPTGAMISRQQLKGFMDRVPGHIIVIVDEAYFEYAQALSDDYPDSTHFDYPNIITLRTFSKAYGIAGIRIGYGIARSELIAQLMKVKLTFEPSNLAQAAGLGALDDREFLEQAIRNNSEGIHYFYEEFKKLGLSYYASYGNFVMIDFGSAERVQKLFKELMARGVFVRPLPAFGLPHCLRITVGTPKENQLCVKMLKEVL